MYFNFDLGIFFTDQSVRFIYNEIILDLDEQVNLFLILTPTPQPAHLIFRNQTTSAGI